MKYLYIGGGILLALLCVCILLGSVIANRVDEPERLLAQAVDALDGGDFSAATGLAREAREEWEARRHLLSALLSHQELEEVVQGFAELESYALGGEETEFRVRCQSLRERLRHIAEMDVPNYYNFLTRCIGA